MVDMKTYDLGDLAGKSGGEYVLGLKDLKTHAVYIVYGFLEAGEGGRKLLPGRGHEEILFVVGGEIVVETPVGEVKMGFGEALHLREDDEYYLRNPGGDTACYVLAGGHPPVQHA